MVTEACRSGVRPIRDWVVGASAINWAAWGSRGAVSVAMDRITWRTRDIGAGFGVEPEGGLVLIGVTALDAVGTTETGDHGGSR